MPPHIKNERARLLRRREQLLDHLAQHDPDAVQEFRSISAALQVMEAPESGRYARFRSYKDAITSLLEFEGQWLSKRVIADKLFRGGFIMDPEIGPRLVIDNLNKNIQRGNFAADENGYVGLNEWGKDK